MSSMINPTHILRHININIRISTHHRSSTTAFPDANTKADDDSSDKHNDNDMIAFINTSSLGHVETNRRNPTTLPLHVK